MAIEDWLTATAIKAIFNKLEKGAIRIGGLDPEGRELVIWVSQPKSFSKDCSEKESSSRGRQVEPLIRQTKKERVR